MKSSWLSAAVGSVTLMISVGAYAASPTPPPFNWTGFYVGLNAGGFGGNANANTSTSCTPAGCFFGDATNTNFFNSVGSQRDNPSGFIGGGQVGFNWQSGNLVAGLETDFQSFKQNGRGSVTGIVPSGPVAGLPFTISQSFSTDWLWTLRPRLGVAANNWLFYATGGLAVTEVNANWLYSDPFNDSEAASISRMRTGWAIGAGVEYAVLNGWSFKAEYLHLDFGTTQITTNNLLDSGVPDLGQPFLHSISLTSEVFRVGVNYRLGGR
jgi:outer membrane immunogenic protein